MTTRRKRDSKGRFTKSQRRRKIKRNPLNRATRWAKRNKKGLMVAALLIPGVPPL